MLSKTVLLSHDGADRHALLFNKEAKLERDHERVCGDIPRDKTEIIRLILQQNLQATFQIKTDRHCLHRQAEGLLTGADRPE